MDEEVIDLGSDDEVIDLGNDDEVIDLGSDDEAPSLGTPPIRNLETDPEGSIWNRAKEAMSGAAATVLAPVFQTVEGVADRVTGRTPEEKRKEEIATTTTSIGERSPEKGGGQYRVPSWDKRLAAIEEIHELEASRDSLTKKQLDKLNELKATEDAFSKLAPLPKAPKTPRNTAGMAANMTDEEVAAIAHQFGADTGWLLSRLPREGITLESTQAQIDAGEGGQSLLGQAAGFLDASAGLGVGKYADRAAASIENRRALEAIRRVANARFGNMRVGAEIGVGIPFGIAQGAAILKGAALIRAPETAALTADVLGSGAVLGLTQSETTDNPAASAVGGALVGSPFLGLGPATAGAGKVTKAAFRAARSATSAQVMAAAPHIYEQAVMKVETNLQPRIGQMVQDAMQGNANDDARNLAARLGMDSALTAPDANVSKFLFDQNSGAFTKANGQTSQEFKRLLVEQEFDSETAKKLNGIFPSSILGRALDAIGAAPQTAAVYDARHGTHGMQTIDDLGVRLRVSGNIADTYGTQFVKEVVQPLNKRKHLVPEFKGLTQDAILARMYDMIDNNRVPPQLQDVATNVAKFFENVRQEVNKVADPETGKPVVTIQKLAGGGAYVPHMTKRGVDKAVVLEDRVGKQAAALMMTKHGRWKDIPEGLRSHLDLTEVTRVLGLLEGKSQAELPSWETSDVIKAFQRHVSLGKTTVEGFAPTDNPVMLAALEQRTGGVPDWFREKNLAKVTANYLGDALHQVFIEPKMRDMEHLRNMMEKFGDPDGHRFYSGWINQMRRGDSSLLGPFNVGGAPAAVVRKLKMKAKLKAADAESNGAKDAADLWRMTSEIPDKLLESTRHNMYSYFLGVPNAKAVIENALQPFVMGVPQLGGTYGTSVITRAMTKKMPKNQITQGGRAIAYEQGTELKQLLRGELEKQGVVGKAAHQASNLGLLLFNMTERWSRDTASKMGAVLAEDFLSRKPAAVKFVEGMPGSYGRAIVKEASRGNVEGVQTLMENFMTARTALDYSTASKSEFARSLGPIFGAFTRWPSEALGTANQALRGREYGTNPIKHAWQSPAGGHAKLLAAMLLSEKSFEVSQGYDDARKENEMYSYITGGKGTSAFSPATMLGQAFSEAGRYKSPVLETALTLGQGVAGKLGEELNDEDTAEANLKLQRALDSTLGMVAPGMWLFKLNDAIDSFKDDELASRKARGPVQTWSER